MLLQSSMSYVKVKVKYQGHSVRKNGRCRCVHVSQTHLVLYVSESITCLFNPLPHMPILGTSNLATNKDMMSKIWTNGDTIIRLSRKHCGKRRNCSLRAISPFSTMFSKAALC